jgi:hypothetical protein
LDKTVLQTETLKIISMMTPDNIKIKLNTMVEVFKTDVADLFQSAVITLSIYEEFPDYEVSFDLSDYQKILRVEGQKIDVNKVIALVHKEGYRCQPIFLNTKGT